MMKFKHLEEKKVSYICHFIFSARLSFVYLKGFLKGVTHSFYPDIYEDYTEKTDEEIKNLKVIFTKQLD